MTKQGIHDTPKFERIIELGKDSLVYGATSAASGLIGLILLPVYTKKFLASEYGALEVLLALAQIFVLIIGLQIESGVARFYYEKRDFHPDVLSSTGFIIRAFFSLVFTIFIIFIFNGTYSFISFFPENRICKNDIVISLAAIPLMALFSYILVLLRLQNQPSKYAALSLFNLSLMAILNMLFILKLDFGINGVFLGILLSYSLSTIIALYIVRDRLLRGFSIILAKDILLYSIPIIPTVVINWARIYSDRFLLVPIVGLDEIGIYSLGIRISSVVLLFVSSFTLAWLPFSMSLINDENNKEIYSTVLTYYTAILIFIALLVDTFSYELIHYLIPEIYWGAEQLIGILSISTVFIGITSIVAIGCNIAKKTYLLTISFLIGFIIGSICLLVFTPIVGIIGAAIANLVSALVSAILAYYLSQKEYNINYNLRSICFILSISIVVIFLNKQLDGITIDFLRYALKLILICISAWGIFLTIDLKALIIKLHIIIFRHITS